MLELDQILLWVVGYSVHDDENSLCVPDFSCCFPVLLVPREHRETYLAAYMRQFDEEMRRAEDARMMVNRMKVRFLALRLAGAWERKQ